MRHAQMLASSYEQTPSAEATRTPLALGSGSGGPSSPSPICEGCDARCWRDTEGRNSSSSLPPLSLKIDSLRVRLRVFVGNGAAQTSGRYIDLPHCQQ